MKLYFFCILLGLGGVVFSQGVWVWDGSYLFFKTLDSQTLLIPHSRWIVIPPQLALLALSQVTDNMRVLSWGFGGVYALMSLAPLLACAYLLPKDQFGWVALGYSSTTLAAQFPLYSESTLATQFFWAVLAGIMTNRPTWASFFAALMLISHPVAILFLGVAVLVAPQKRIMKPSGFPWAFCGVIFKRQSGACPSGQFCSVMGLFS